MNLSTILEKIEVARSVWVLTEDPGIGEFALSSDMTLKVTEHKLPRGIKRRYIVYYQDQLIVMSYDWGHFSNSLSKAPKQEQMKKLDVHDQDLRDKVRLKCKNDWGHDLTEDEVSMCIYEMEEQQLSLFHNQIWPNKRTFKDKSTNQWESRITWDKTIDGYRAIAHRSGRFSGMDKAVFSLDDDGGLMATITVYMIDSTGQRRAIEGEARFNEFVQMIPAYENGRKVGVKPANQWSDSPHNQLAIAAERQALRKAFQECAEVKGEALADPRPDTAPEPIDQAPEKPIEESRGRPEPAAIASANAGRLTPPPQAPPPEPEPEPEPEGTYVGIPRDGFKVFGMYNKKERIIICAKRGENHVLALDSGKRVTINSEGYEIERVNRKDSKKGGRNWSEGEKYYDGSTVEKVGNSKKDESAAWLALDSGFKVMVDGWGKEVNRKERKDKKQSAPAQDGPPPGPPPEHEAPASTPAPPSEESSAAFTPSAVEIIEAMDDVAEVRQAARPLFQKWCMKELGKKISPKEAYGQMTGVQLGRGQSMTLDDWKTLYNCLMDWWETQ